MTSYIYINRDNVIANETDGGNRPVITVLQDGESRDVQEVLLLGPSRVVYSHDRTLRKGYDTRAWVETDHQIEVTP
jgi:hypothetical protein